MPRNGFMYRRHMRNAESASSHTRIIWLVFQSRLHGLLSAMQWYQLSMFSSIQVVYLLPYRAYSGITTRIWGLQVRNMALSVNLDVAISMYNFKKEVELSLLPCYTQTFSNLTFTVISIQKPHIDLSKRFAISSDTAVILPDNFRFPIMCHSKEQAQFNFSSCANTLFCDCDLSGHMPSCHCLHGELSTLIRYHDNLLPLSSARLAISRDSNALIAETDESETTVVISSRQRLESAHLNIDILCEVHTGTLYGC